MLVADDGEMGRWRALAAGSGLSFAEWLRRMVRLGVAGQSVVADSVKDRSVVDARFDLGGRDVSPRFKG